MLNKLMRTKKCRALHLLKRMRVAPAEDTLPGGQFGSQGGKGARNVAWSSSAVDLAGHQCSDVTTVSPAASTHSCHLFLFGWTVEAERMGSGNKAQAPMNVHKS